MRIAIVNDLQIAVESMRVVVSRHPEYSIAWIANDGAEAVKRCAQDTPDLILMDLMMPVMDGVEATRQIMKNTPCPILVVTSSVTQNSSKVFEAMGAGALDAVATPVLRMNKEEEGSLFLQKIARIYRLHHAPHVPLKTAATSRPVQIQIASKSTFGENKALLVAIGCSTGGPQAMLQILSKLPKNFPAAIVVIQHMNEEFVKGLVEWLDDQINLPVRLMRSGDRPEPGVVLIPRTSGHAVLSHAGYLLYTSEPASAFYHPSVNVFFKSVAQNWNGNCIAVLLTGMGKDGAEGLLELRQKGYHTIIQDEKTCVVYGMPKAAYEIGAAVDILPIDYIGNYIGNLVQPVTV